jgi:hypothetical protein
MYGSRRCYGWICYCIVNMLGKGYGGAHVHVRGMLWKCHKDKTAEDGS